MAQTCATRIQTGVIRLDVPIGGLKNHLNVQNCNNNEKCDKLQIQYYQIITQYREYKVYYMPAY